MSVQSDRGSLQVRDAWFMAGWDKDFDRGKPTSATILEEPIATAAPRMMPLVMDKAVLTYEGVVKRLLRAEAESALPTRRTA